MKNTHAAIAERSGVSRSYVTMIINRQRCAKPKTAKKLAKASGWSWLFWAHPLDFDRQGRPLPQPAGQAPHERDPHGPAGQGPSARTPPCRNPPGPAPAGSQEGDCALHAADPTRRQP